MVGRSSSVKSLLGIIIELSRSRNSKKDVASTFAGRRACDAKKAVLTFYEKARINPLNAWSNSDFHRHSLAAFWKAQDGQEIGALLSSWASVGLRFAKGSRLTLRRPSEDDVARRDSCLLRRLLADVKRLLSIHLVVQCLLRHFDLVGRPVPPSSF